LLVYQICHAIVRVNHLPSDLRRAGELWYSPFILTALTPLDKWTKHKPKCGSTKNHQVN